MPLIPKHGFTRHAIALAASTLPEVSTTLSDTAITSLFGKGDHARVTLIKAWLEEGLEDITSSSDQSGSIRGLLQRRLDWNVPVIEHLPEVSCTTAIRGQESSVEI